MEALLAGLRDLLLRMLPHAVRPGLLPVGSPGPDSPVLLSCNYALTVRRLERALAGRDLWLLVADSRGINVWCAATGGHLTHHDVISALRTSGIGDRVHHRELLLPQLAATGVEPGKIFRATGWKARWGPVHLEDLPGFLDGSGDPEKLRTVRFPLRDRLEMASVWAVPLTLLLALGLGLALGWGVGVLAATTASVEVAAIFTLLPRLPVTGRRRWLTYGTAAAAGFALGAGALGLFAAATPGRLAALAAASAGAMLVLSLDLAGTTPWYPGSVNSFGNRFALELEPERCTGAAVCVEVCPREVLEMDWRERRVEIARPGSCVLCAACIVQCPDDAFFFRYEDGSAVSPATIRRTRLNLLGRRTVEVEAGE